MADVISETKPLTTPLRTVRQAQRRGLREVARAAGLDPGLVSRIERRKRRPSVDQLHALARELGMPLHHDLEPYIGLIEKRS